MEMTNTFWTALATSIMAAFITSLGIFTIRRFTGWGQRNTTYFMCFAAGVLISASFLHIIPKSFRMSAQAPVWLLVGFFGLHLFNRFLTSFVCEKDPEKKDYVIGIIPMFGIGLHSFIDGIIYSIAFTVSILTGFLATMGMVLHEFPEGIITYLLLVRGGFTERRAMQVAFLAAAATTPLGMLVSYPVISEIKGQTLGLLLSLSAGALVYVGATHLLPRAEQENKRFSLVALAGGVLVAVIIVMSKS
jgi:zinc and cadmium transporter